MEVPLEWMHARIFTVGHFVQNGKLLLLTGLKNNLQQLGVNLEDVIVPADDQEDELIGEPGSNGSLAVREAYERYREKGTALHWQKRVWRRYIPQKISCFVGEIWHDRLPTKENAKARGVIVDGGCNRPVLRYWMPTAAGKNYAP